MNEINNGVSIKSNNLINNGQMAGGLNSKNYYEAHEKNNQNSGNINMTKNQNLTTGNVTGGIIGGRDASGVAAGKDVTGTVAGGNIYGTVSTAINQLPECSEPDKPGIKELLTQLKEAIASEPNISEDDQETALEEIKNLAQAATHPGNEGMKKIAKRAIQMLKGIFSGLPTIAKLAETAKVTLPALASMFGLE
ncbi:MAG: hypothetical protein O4807_17375 [Trichodesmium sp. St19_bin2]|nr:hypothetical protein [Trichodesmium sp. St19_bin2]